MLKGLGCTRLRATTAKKVSCQVRTASAATRPRTHQRQPGGKAARLNKNQGTKVHAYFQDDEPEEVPLRYPDPEYIEETLKCFPDDGVASVEQGRVLYSEGGYTFLDVRSKPEFNDDGKVPNAVNIPLINTTRKWDLSGSPPELVVEQSANKDFLDEIKAKFPDKESKLLIVCSTGTQRAIQCLMLLDGEGYTNIVGLKGGFNGWNAVWTTKLERRGTNVQYTTVYQADGDAMGIHSTGAGFSSVDKVDFNINAVDTTEWLKWKDEVTQNA
mmetsp:Transcript_4967/g.8831  ORF Transcript_4967/g.8831 Transcript_4967/m.8831 type:complete len:271 (-) Transcript_4967:352-1164(-)|eukprot:CAMPEP_0197484090 /NCGR_PEP_ID=MMETSP1309-20131121/57225_1 /TAXON_ID=464262 /ORGANISM="Genus nov. species nov., Strain RCC998" /LENGTH=270 /DNA_ID=CAMNT_0043026723 /DNA_START=635 /DNA_END=1447 /DNA_ORIENTATION=-